MELRERICRYLSQVPPAVSGAGGHNQTFSVACALVNGFGLDEIQALEFLTLYSDRCQPPWAVPELEHKIKSAASAQHTKIRGHLLGPNGFVPEDFRSGSLPAKPPQPVIKADPLFEIEKWLRNKIIANEADVWEASPIRPPDDWNQDGLCLLQHLYQPGEIINFVTDYKLTDLKNGLTKPIPRGYGESVERDALILRWRTKGMPQSDAGGWMRMNPVDGHGIADENISAFRFILLEFDDLSLKRQLAMLSTLPVPVAVILTSGARSLHAWVKADAKDLQEYRATSQRLLKMLARFGMDAKNKNPSRLSRLVGVTRIVGAADDGRQRLLYLNANPTGKPIIYES